MTKTLLPILAGLLLLAGCSQNYVIVKTDGSRLSVSNKPKYVNGYYYFRDASGRDTRIFASRVREVAPASMVEDANARFKPVQSK